MDAEIGRLLERLRHLGLDRSTLVVFTSDHGARAPTVSSTALDPVAARLDSAGAALTETVGTIDVMRTLLERLRALGTFSRPAGGADRSANPCGAPAVR